MFRVRVGVRIGLDVTDESGVTAAVAVTLTLIRTMTLTHHSNPNPDTDLDPNPDANPDPSSGKTIYNPGSTTHRFAGPPLLTFTTNSGSGARVAWI